MSKLLSPLTIRNMHLSSRLVMPPMATMKAEDGVVNDIHTSYYRERSSEKIGLIITEHCYVSLEGRCDAHQVSVSRDSDIEGLSALAAAIKSSGSCAVCQISHTGSKANPASTGLGAVGVCADDGLKHQGEVSPLDKDGIKRIVRCFADGARRVKEAGFDGVEFHSAHGFLLNQFYSPLTNRRTDEYGGTLENRIRIHVEIIKAVREAVGDGFAVGIRIGGCDYDPNGTTVEDTVNACRAFEDTGIDFIDISGSFTGFTNPDSKEPGYFSHVSRAVKNAVNIPVILTGGITTGEQAEALLLNGDADLIGVGRPLMKDARWAEDNVK